MGLKAPPSLCAGPFHEHVWCNIPCIMELTTFPEISHKHRLIFGLKEHQTPAVDGCAF